MNITQKTLKEALYYDPLTGLFIWLNRPVDHFANVGTQKQINTKHAGKFAGTTDDKGYIKIQLFGNKYRAHRLAWLYVHGELPEDIDHKNQKRNDNRIANLRSVNHQTNMMNLPIYTNNSSSVMGVSWHKHREKWWAYGNLAGKRKSLGYFDSFHDAVVTREKWEKDNGFHVNHGKLKASGGY